MRTTWTQAPAKINLGLEIIGKRSDGYHEIRSVMAAIDLTDTISIRPLVDKDAISISGILGVSMADNLIYKAIRRFAEWTGIRSGYDVNVQKRIPSPGGLGGASSDAASTLLSLNSMHVDALTGAHLHDLAASLGSDVPFFLGTSPALASGTGTNLQPLPSISGYAVLVIPTVSIPAKTATLYASLMATDMSDGARADDVAGAIRSGKLPHPSLLTNAFSRALYDRVPGLRGLAEEMIAAGAPYAALSGAGPTHYVLCENRQKATQLAEDLESRLGDDTRVCTAQFIELAHGHR